MTQLPLIGEEEAVLRRLASGESVVYSGPFDRPEGWSYRWGFFGASNELESDVLERAVTSLRRQGYVECRPIVSDATLFQITGLGLAALTTGKAE